MSNKLKNKYHSSWSFSIVLLIFAIFFIGCGAPGSSDEGIQVVDALSVPTEKVNFKVQTADGILTFNTVVLVSLLKGVLSSEVITGDDGKATILVNKQTIQNLNDSDLLYFYSESTVNSSVILSHAGGQSKTLLKNQATLRSFLGKASTTKASIDLFKPTLTNNPQLGKRAKINHFSNAKFILLEEQLKNANIITSPITPNNQPVLSSSQLSQVNGLHIAIEDQIKVLGSDTAKKFLLISNATKAIIEEDLGNFIEASNNFPINQPLSILLELQESNGSTLTTQFRDLLPSLSERVSADLTSELFSDSIASNSVSELNNIVQNLQTITPQEIEESIQTDLTIDPVSSVDPIIVSTTTLIHHVQFMTSKTSLTGASLRINPTIVKTKGESFGELLFDLTP
ncbi:MAG: hypothetical protein KC646_16700 [Candidatus Cloacimonetes bacterium]|nr:hypothetical protein [Candidatus Cloacimonadota bacterium]